MAKIWCTLVSCRHFQFCCAQWEVWATCRLHSGPPGCYLATASANATSNIHQGVSLLLLQMPNGVFPYCSAPQMLPLANSAQHLISQTTNPHYITDRQEEQKTSYRPQSEKKRSGCLTIHSKSGCPGCPDSAENSNSP